MSTDVADPLRNGLEEYPTFVNILGAFRENSSKEEHNVVEGIESMPECGGKEYKHTFFLSSALAFVHKACLNVKFEPQVYLMVPALKHSHAGVGSLYSHNIDSNNFVPFVISFLIFSIIGKATSNYSSVRHHERSVVEESLACHCNIKENYSIPDRHSFYLITPAVRDREVGTYS